jgi:carbonic anhydrase/acetyltransferase-like protein (isoleucine patch superfamily)
LTFNAQLPRKQKKLVKEALRNHDANAARMLLAHSITFGHGRLAISRYLSAHYLGANDLDVFVPHCRDLLGKFSPEALLTLARKVARELHLDVDAHCGLSNLLTRKMPLNLPYSGVWPSINAAPQYCGDQVSLVGRVEIGKNAWFGPGAVVRGDGHFVCIGNDFRMGARATVHIAHEMFPTLIVDRVTIGRNVVVHACSIGRDCVIEDDAVILDGAVLQDNVLVEAGSTVFPRSVLESGWVYAGCPAKPVRVIDKQELHVHGQSVADAIFRDIFTASATLSVPRVLFDRQVYVATTADLQGNIRIGEGSGIFFGCRLNGHAAGIEIGPGCNVQDNVFIEAPAEPVKIGANVTVGHNVDMASCMIGDNSFIGMGSKLAAGTVVEDDVFVASGAIATPGQRLERGWLWGGRPARPIAKLDDSKRAMMAATIKQYQTYSANWAAAQRILLQEEH